MMVLFYNRFFLNSGLCFRYEGRIDSIDCQEIVHFSKGTRRLFCIVAYL